MASANRQVPAFGNAPGMTRPVKHSFTINGHRTSISLEQAFWDALKAAAVDCNLPIAALVSRIDAERGDAGLSSAIRVWLLAHKREQPKTNAAPPS